MSNTFEQKIIHKTRNEYFYSWHFDAGMFEIMIHLASSSAKCTPLQIREKSRVWNIGELIMGILTHQSSNKPRSAIALSTTHSFRWCWYVIKKIKYMLYSIILLYRFFGDNNLSIDVYYLNWILPSVSSVCLRFNFSYILLWRGYECISSFVLWSTSMIHYHQSRSLYALL